MNFKIILMSNVFRDILDLQCWSLDSQGEIQDDVEDCARPGHEITVSSVVTQTDDSSLQVPDSAVSISLESWRTEHPGSLGLELNHQSASLSA